MIYVKTGLPGEGKTKWLLDKCHDAVISKHYDTIYFVGSSKEYIRFCEKYRSIYNAICPVENYNEFTTSAAFSYLESTCVLIDNYFSNQVNGSIREALIRKAEVAYITIEGCTDNDIKSTAAKYEQLHIAV